MRILTSKVRPTTKELAGILKQEFSGNYSYQLFGPTNEKSIIVRKSARVGAQISMRENEISVQGTYPSIATSVCSIFLFYLLGLGDPSLSLSWKKFEKEIGSFLSQKYH